MHARFVILTKAACGRVEESPRRSDVPLSKQNMHPTHVPALARIVISTKDAIAAAWRNLVPFLNC